MQLRNLLAAVLISPELLVALAVLALHLNYPSPFEFIGSKLISDAENWKYIIVVPPVLVGVSFRAMSDMRAPSDKEQGKILYSWPAYRLLVGRLYVAVAISSLAAATSVALCLFGKGLTSAVVGSVFVGALAISITVAASLWFARDRLKELLVHHGG